MEIKFENSEHINNYCEFGFNKNITWQIFQHKFILLMEFFG